MATPVTCDAPRPNWRKHSAMGHHDLKANDLAVGFANHLDDPGLLDRLTGECVGYDDAPEPNIPSVAKRKRKPSLAAALRQAAATGVTVNGATIKPDGSVALTFGERDDAKNGNPWDEVLTNAAH